MELVRQFSIKLRKILLCNYIYKIIIILSLIYIFLYYIFYKQTLYDDTKDEFEIVIREILFSGNQLKIYTDKNLIGTYYFKDKKELEYYKNKYEIGDKLVLKGKLISPSNNTILNAFNYKKYLYYKKIDYLLEIESIKLIKKNTNIINKIKNITINRINKIKDNEYLYAFILGKSNYIEENIYENYKINGITHLFALSGLHVSLFSSVIVFLLNKLKFKEKLSLVITVIFLIMFAFIASFTPSILRAVFFFIFSSLNKIYYTYIRPINLLYLIFSIMIFINPFYIFNIGFILSFVISFFILLFNENYEIKKKYSILIISLVSFLASIPIIININYEINIIGFINNIFFIPFVSYIVFPISLLTFIFPFLNVLLQFNLNIMQFISNISAKILNITLYFSKLNYIEILLYYLLLILIIKRKRKYIKYLFILLLIVYFKNNFDKSDYVYYIDVKQADCILIRTKNNKTILIDTAGKENYNNEKWKEKNRNFNLMIDSIIPFFKSIGIRKIDYLIITHGDYDHMGDAFNLVENFKVDSVVFNCGTYNKLEKSLIEVLDKKNIKYYSCINDLNIDKYKLEFLNTNIYDNENDNSNVIYFNYNNYKFLFMGDAGIDREKEILEKYNLKDIDFLKVGHHGSNTSSSEEFINSINPKYSIISVGKDNRYGHPKNSVLEILKDSKIYRTDKEGSIEIKLNKDGYKISTCPP